MNDGKRVGGAERVRGFLHDPAGLFYRELSAAANPGGYGLAIHVPHDEVHQPLALTDRVNRDDVRVGQPGCSLSLASESLAGYPAETRAPGAAP